MGNYKFKFSNMLPNAWFYKLKYTTPIKTKSLNSSYYRKTHHKTSSFAARATVTPPQAWRQSYHFQRELNYVRPTQSFTEEPRKATKMRRSTKKTRACTVNSSASSYESFLSKSELIPEKYPSYSPDSSCFDDSGFSDLDSEFERQKVDSLSEANHNYVKFEEEFDLVSELELNPIITKKIDNERDHEIPAAAIFQRTREQSSHNDKSYTKKHRKAAAKKMTVNSPGGAKVKNYHPKTGTKRGGQVHGQKSMSSAGQKNVTSEMKNVIIVKDSIDPDADFKESMVEMILENNIRTSKDLEKLLVCYLSLNSAAYHSRIVKIFEQIWFQITDI